MTGECTPQEIMNQIRIDFYGRENNKRNGMIIEVDDTILNLELAPVTPHKLLELREKVEEFTIDAWESHPDTQDMARILTLRRDIQDAWIEFEELGGNRDNYHTVFDCTGDCEPCKGERECLLKCYKEKITPEYITPDFDEEYDEIKMDLLDDIMYMTAQQYDLEQEVSFITLDMLNVDTERLDRYKKELDKCEKLQAQLGFSDYSEAIYRQRIMNKYEETLPLDVEVALNKGEFVSESLTPTEAMDVYRSTGYLPKEWDQRLKVIKNISERLNAQGNNIPEYEKYIKEWGHLTDEQKIEDEKARVKALSKPDYDEYKRMRRDAHTNFSYRNYLPSYPELKFINEQLKENNANTITYFRNEAACVLFSLGIIEKPQLDNHRELTHPEKCNELIDKMFKEFFPTKRASCEVAIKQLIKNWEAFYRKTGPQVQDR